VFGVCVVLGVTMDLPVTVPYHAQWILVLILLGFNVIYHLYTHYLRSQSAGIESWVRVAKVQIFLDFLILTLQLHYSGGMENPFAVYYLFHTAFAGLLLTPRAAIFATGWGAMLYTLLVVGECVSVIPHYSLGGWYPLDLYRHPGAILGALIPLITAMIFMTYLMSAIGQDIGQKETHLLDLQEKLKSRSRELAKANKQLSRHMQEREQFMLTVEHEFKSPLASIQMVIDSLLLTHKAISPGMQDMIFRIRRRTIGLLSLVHDLLTLSRLNLQETDTTPVPINFSEIIWGEIEAIRPFAVEKGLALHTQITSHLWLAGCAETARHCVSNLLTNAVRYTPQGLVIVSAQGIDQQLVFMVKDTGMGIEPSEIPKIFQDFYRTSRAKELVAEGTGVGMSLVKRAVELLHGTIQIESQVDTGTTIWVRFPLSPSPTETVGTPPSSPLI
jgi:signal transduction histidine kinase